ncbi:hypothetical protein [Pseudactinotalea sp. HY158]|uniref:hypothetical protein n=1 Tax=Pseudactinotalea sp. HY158 TaxID=2654547 RepID=UPI00129C3BC1|nr:hypothetical protein [Pseudactinotalea sp. HY158]QGH68675.1 hypothetical protein GCE65_03545 [Pseudactinotalea sp. HY158]
MEEVGEYERLGIVDGVPLGRAVCHFYGSRGVGHRGVVEFAHRVGLLVGDDTVLLDPELGVGGEVEVPPGSVRCLRIQVVWSFQQRDVALQDCRPDRQLLSGLSQSAFGVGSLDLDLAQSDTDLLARQRAVLGEVEQFLLTHVERGEALTVTVVEFANSRLLVRDGLLDRLCHLVAEVSGQAERGVVISYGPFDLVAG